MLKTESNDKEKVVLFVSREPEIYLRAATNSDLENLRKWKNEQREFFFHKEEITPQEQYKWFLAFQDRPYDFMFMVAYEERIIGCMGIRWLDGTWDIYNVILGRPEFGGRGLMGKAFKMMLNYVVTLRKMPITLKVLKHNPAVHWYEKNGFAISAEHDDHFQMEYQANNI